jgi:hypothetical protein
MTLTMSPRTSQRLNVRAIRERYTAAKRQLARRDWPDMNAYADAKTMVIQKITADAEQWPGRHRGRRGRRIKASNRRSR